MIKIFLKFVGYILLKWLCFYIYELAVNGFKWNSKANKEGYILAAIMLFTLPLLEIIVLISPIHFALKQKGCIMISILIFAFLLEFMMSWYTTNQQIQVWMFVKMILSIGLFYYLYRKELTKS
ncbi:hypothetical protein [Arcicella rigui]|uniref:Uncharacterized protein n=1 Tax=Arcicella rigui TaxID=797020 RepID=A0ABU5QDV2_9BACT|nr:hypothetical protein [Arcicella rigui]MEA5141033.1 hypothetical protein [Arcicella rigui]